MRVLQALTEANTPLTIIALTAELGGHPNSIRLQLESLVESGFVSETTLNSGGRGRPARIYEPTVAGHQIVGQENYREDGSALIAAIADQIAAGPDPTKAARDFGHAWGKRLASDERGLLETLAGQGFTPREVPGGYELRTCPLLDTAREAPEIVCAIHQGLAEALAGETLEVAPFSVPGACMVYRRGESKADSVPSTASGSADTA